MPMIDRYYDALWLLLVLFVTTSRCICSVLRPIFIHMTLYFFAHVSKAECMIDITSCPTGELLHPHCVSGIIDDVSMWTRV